ncbi:MAG: hypothetical protein ACFFDI_19625 [Promethearchaeota archaeon]
MLIWRIIKRDSTFTTSTPSPPMKVEQFDDEVYAYDVVVSGPYVYVVDDSDGLESIDLSTSASPTEGGQFDAFPWYEIRYK